jgi:hypothetical protein
MARYSNTLKNDHYTIPIDKVDIQEAKWAKATGYKVTDDNKMLGEYYSDFKHIFSSSFVNLHPSVLSKRWQAFNQYLPNTDSIQSFLCTPSVHSHSNQRHHHTHDTHHDTSSRVMLDESNGCWNVPYNQARLGHMYGDNTMFQLTIIVQSHLRITNAVTCTYNIKRNNDNLQVHNDDNDDIDDDNNDSTFDMIVCDMATRLMCVLYSLHKAILKSQLKSN